MKDKLKLLGFIETQLDENIIKYQKGEDIVYMYENNVLTIPGQLGYVTYQRVEKFLKKYSIHEKLQIFVNLGFDIMIESNKLVKNLDSNIELVLVCNFDTGKVESISLDNLVDVPFTDPTIAVSKILDLYDV